MSKDVKISESGDGDTQTEAENSVPLTPPPPSPPLELKSTCYSNFIQQTSIYGVVVGYCISGSLLSIVNKWAIMKFPYPGGLTEFQYFTSAAAVLLCGWLRFIDHDRLEFVTMRKFTPAAIVFYLSLFSNSQLLFHANVDTFIAFRSAVRIFAAFGETFFLNRSWPSSKTWLSLGVIFAGGVLYVLTDNQFNLTGYSWRLAYLVCITVDSVYIKHVTMTIGLNTWGLVLYNNVEAFLLCPMELLIMGEWKKIKHEFGDDLHSFQVILPVGISCLFGLAISFFGFSCRKMITATGFTVISIVNKLLTLVINLVIWDKQSTLVGTIGLLICMIGGVMYHQSTNSKAEEAVEETKPQANGEEELKLLEKDGKKESNVNPNE